VPVLVGVPAGGGVAALLRGGASGSGRVEPALAGAAFFAGALAGAAFAAAALAGAAFFAGVALCSASAALSAAAPATFFAAAPAFSAASPAGVSPAVPSIDIAASSTTPAVVAAALATAAVARSVIVGCGAPAAGSSTVPPSPAASWAASRSANWLSILPATSVITPRPNWAGRPVMVRSLETCARVPVPSAVSVTVTTADAVPLPRWSLPRASRTTRCAAGSLSLTDTRPW
jgi:hypothetical protein